MQIAPAGFEQDQVAPIMVARPQDGKVLQVAVPFAVEPAMGELIAIQAIGWPFATLCLTAFLFWMGIPIGPIHLWVGLAASLIAGRLIVCGWRTWLAATTWLVAVTAAGGTALGWLYDFSGDGQWYHVPAVLGLAEGWNPVKTARLVDWNGKFEQEIPSAAIYVQHYAKGVWIVAAAAYRATGLLEATKVFNLLYLLATYLIAAGFLRRLGLSRVWAHALALTAAVNPVILYQMHSFFVDGQLAALCTLLVVVSLDYFREPRSRTLVLLGACVVLLTNTKFTGLAYAIALGGGLFALIDDAILRFMPGQGDGPIQ